jgi:hypothetical protein
MHRALFALAGVAPGFSPASYCGHPRNHGLEQGCRREILPPHQNPVTIRLDADVLAWLKRSGPGSKPWHRLQSVACTPCPHQKPPADPTRDHAPPSFRTEWADASSSSSLLRRCRPAQQEPLSLRSRFLRTMKSLLIFVSTPPPAALPASLATSDHAFATVEKRDLHSLDHCVAGPAIPSSAFRFEF